MSRKRKFYSGVAITTIAGVAGEIARLRWMRVHGADIRHLAHLDHFVTVVFGDPCTMIVAPLATAASVLGCVWIAQAKGRTWRWGLFGLLSIYGMLVLLLLRSPKPRRAVHQIE